MPGGRLNNALRAALRTERNAWRDTPVTITHSAVSTSGSSVTSTFTTVEPTLFTYLRSGAMGLAPAESRSYTSPGGFVPSGLGRVVFDGLDTGSDGNETRLLLTGAESMHAGYWTTEVSMTMDGREYLPTGVTHIESTEELLVDIHRKS